MKSTWYEYGDPSVVVKYSSATVGYDARIFLYHKFSEEFFFCKLLSVGAYRMVQKVS